MNYGTRVSVEDLSMGPPMIRMRAEVVTGACDEHENHRENDAEPSRGIQGYAWGLPVRTS